MTAEEIARYIAQRVNGEDGRLDAAETAHLSRQLEHVKSKTYDVRYPALRARDFIPLSTEVDPAAETIVYQQWDEVGTAKVIANYADDLPMVDAFSKEYTSKVHSTGAAYQYSIQDLRRSAKAGSQLDVKRAQAARRAIETVIDEIAANGMEEGGLRGFVNHPNVTIVVPTTGAWLGGVTTPMQIIADLNKLVAAVVNGTRSIFKPNTIVMGTSLFVHLAQTFVDAAGQNTTTILRAFLSQNPWIRNIDEWDKLDTAAEDGGPRVVCYLRDAEVCELEIPLDFEQLPPQARGLAFVINCHARVGGTKVYHPLALAYMDP
jgi:hypothetical protein